MTQTPNLDGLRIQRDDKPQNRDRITRWLLVIIILAIAGVVGWSLMRRPTFTVRTAVVHEASASGNADHTVLNASGYVTARREATVSSKVTGKVDEVLIEEGMTV